MYNIMILEDEPLIADYIEKEVRDYFKTKLKSLKVFYTIESAEFDLFKNPIDLLLLDLNLNGKNGFDLLNLAVSASFQTIIITANKAEAVKAFDYGVLDFIAKPIQKGRFNKAMDRFSKQEKTKSSSKYLAFRNHLNVVELIDVDEVTFIKGAGTSSVIHLAAIEKLHDKNLEKLNSILPNHFLRIHKSYIVNKNYIKALENFGAGKIELILKNDVRIPVSRSKYKELKAQLTFE